MQLVLQVKPNNGTKYYNYKQNKAYILHFRNIDSKENKVIQCDFNNSVDTTRSIVNDAMLLDGFYQMQYYYASLRNRMWFVIDYDRTEADSFYVSTTDTVDRLLGVKFYGLKRNIINIVGTSNGGITAAGFQADSVIMVYNPHMLGLGYTGHP